VVTFGPGACRRQRRAQALRVGAGSRRGLAGVVQHPAHVMPCWTETWGAFGRLAGVPCPTHGAVSRADGATVSRWIQRGGAPLGFRMYDGQARALHNGCAHWVGRLPRGGGQVRRRRVVWGSAEQRTLAHLCQECRAGPAPRAWVRVGAGGEAGAGGGWRGQGRYFAVEGIRVGAAMVRAAGGGCPSGKKKTRGFRGGGHAGEGCVGAGLDAVGWWGVGRLFSRRRALGERVLVRIGGSGRGADGATASGWLVSIRAQPLHRGVLCGANQQGRQLPWSHMCAARRSGAAQLIHTGGSWI